MAKYAYINLRDCGVVSEEEVEVEKKYNVRLG